jgi:hypothetical protein
MEQLYYKLIILDSIDLMLALTQSDLYNLAPKSKATKVIVIRVIDSTNAEIKPRVSDAHMPLQAGHPEHSNYSCYSMMCSVYSFTQGVSPRPWIKKALDVTAVHACL